jgi:ribose 5-phosphate isomerase RpiB
MKIAVVNEISTADRNAAVVAALEGRGHKILNAGMRRAGDGPELTVVHTTFLSALLLATGRADMIVGGCGTGHGYEIAVSQYPGVTSGRILGPLDAWLFAQINDGNVISLALNLGFGWAAEVNLKMIFDALFSVEPGAGYPAHRRPTQSESRGLVGEISAVAHRSWPELLRALPDRIVNPALTYPGIWELLDVETLADREVAAALATRYEAARAQSVA